MTTTIFLLQRTLQTLHTFHLQSFDKFKRTQGARSNCVHVYSIEIIVHFHNFIYRPLWYDARIQAHPRVTFLTKRNESFDQANLMIKLIELSVA
uniref:Uncharacterized protein n=1 Tax=Arundo donax TaxID=35708 RepID=A0A0A9B6A9_ARUDO